MIKILIICGMAIGLCGCALAVPAAVGAGVATVIANKNNAGPDYVPPRPQR